jgi:inhibitor of KinA sporulation pathway (predicted exonuclease)
MKPTSTGKLLPSDRTALAKLRLQEKMAARKKAKENKNNDDDDNESAESSTDEEERARQKRNTFGSLSDEADAKKKAPPATTQKKQKTVASPPAKVSTTNNTNAEKQQQPDTKNKNENEASPIAIAVPKSKSSNAAAVVASSSAVGVEKEKTAESPKIVKEEKQQQVAEISSSPTTATPTLTTEPATTIEEILLQAQPDENQNDEEEQENIAEAYDEFNLVEHHHQQQNQNQNDDEEQQQNEQKNPPQWQDHGVLLSEQENVEQNPPQHFDYFLLIDFECTCDEHPGFDNEIIEIPALLYDTKTLEIVAEYHTYVKPLRNPDLTPFCKQLTGIRQEQVENAPCYDEAIRNLVTFVQTSLAKLAVSSSLSSTTGDSAATAAARRTDGARLCVATDGPCDLEVFGYLFMHVRDGFAYPNFFQRYIDVKQVYRDEYGEGKYYKIKDMLQRFGLRFEGHQHSGIDDTRNLARIVTQMIKRGTVFSDVYHVSTTSGRRRVPMYIWSKATTTLKRAQQTRRVGNGPMMAERCRKGLLGLSEAEIKQHTSGFSLSAYLRRLAFVRIKVRAGEFMNAPSTGLLVLMFLILVASFLYQKQQQGGEGKMILE